MSAYLSGPIDFTTNRGREWRDDMTTFLQERGVHVFNPLKHVFWGTQDLDTTKRPRMKELLESEKYHELRGEIKDINHWDLRSVDLSSFLVVNYDVSVFTCGTHEEIFNANQQSKPVLFVCVQGRKKMPSWIYGRFPPEHMFESFEELKSYLTAIDSDPNYKFSDADNKRWLFFDGAHINQDFGGKQEKMGLQTNLEIYEEDIRDIALDAFHVIENGLEKFGLKFTNEEEDKLYNSIILALELKAGCPDYRCHL